MRIVSIYRFLDHILEQKPARFQHLRERWLDLFQTQFDVLPYDLASTYIKGGRMRTDSLGQAATADQRFDCKQVAIIFGSLQQQSASGGIVRSVKQKVRAGSSGHRSD